MSTTSLPSHPVLGTVIARHAVSRSYHGVSRSGSYVVGHRYIVRKPDGLETSMTASEWDKKVRQLAPRDVHLIQPGIKVGAFVGFHCPKTGYSWAGTVTKVTRDTFTILPEALENFSDGKTAVEVRETQGETRRELFWFEYKRRSADVDYRNTFHLVEQEVTKATPGMHWVDRSKLVHEDARVVAALEQLRRRDAELRVEYPSVTDREASEIL